MDAPMTDWELLERYARAGDAEAFTEIARRHTDMVYGTARRSAGPQAEDVTQAVFLLLARKAGKLRPTGSLAGWLHGATRWCCLNLKKTEAHRQQRERAAARREVQVMETDDPETMACLDAALASLDPTERDSVLLRYFERHSFGEAGAALGVSAEAARKRSERGLEKLRRFFIKRGYVLALAAVAALAERASAMTAPAGLAEQTAAAAIHGTASAAARELAQSVLRWLRRGKMVRAALWTSAVVALVALGIEFWAAPAKPAESLAQVPPAGTGAGASVDAGARGGANAIGRATRTTPQTVATGSIARGNPLPPGAAAGPPNAATTSTTATAATPVANLVPGVGSITGRFVDGRNRPLANLRLTYSHNVLNVGDGSVATIQALTSTDANGAFTLRDLGFYVGHIEDVLPPPILIFEALNGGEQQGEIVFGFALRDQTEIRLKNDIVAPLGASLTLRLNDPNGQCVDIAEEVGRTGVLWRAPTTGRGR
jgi:RNA polymerase sigma factor (sigma-70 family)